MRRGKIGNYKYLVTAGLLLYALLSFLYFAYKTLRAGFWLIDIEAYWKQMAYFIRGYDITTCDEQGILIESIGKLGGGIVLPWGHLLGNLIYPGFLPLKAATVYYYALMLFFSMTAIGLIVKWIQVHGEKADIKEIFLWSICLFFMPLYWDDALDTGNMGGCCA